MTDVTAPAPAPAPSAPAPAPGPAPAPAPAVSWLPGADADAVGYIQNKGWQGPADVFTNYRHLEQLLGADRAGRTIVLPKDATDVQGLEAMQTKLGWSKDPNAYKLPVPDGADPKFASDMAGMFSKHGVPVAAAQALTADWNTYQAGLAKQQNDAAQAAAEAADAQLTKDWGAERQARTEIARRAAVQLGLDGAALDAMEKGAGYVTVLKALAKVGDMLKESGAAGLDVNPGSFGLTPEGAKSKRTQLIADKDFREKAMVKGSAQWSEMERLNKIIAESMQGA